MRTPDIAQCKNQLGQDLGPGHWLPQDRSEAVLRRLVELQGYPIRAQARLDALVTRVGEATTAVCAAAAKVERESSVPDGYGLPTVIAWGLVGIVAGGAAATLAVLASQ